MGAASKLAAETDVTGVELMMSDFNRAEISPTPTANIRASANPSQHQRRWALAEVRISRTRV
jgi:hypothetical protein